MALELGKDGLLITKVQKNPKQSLAIRTSKEDLSDPTLYDNGKLESVRNPDGFWINTQCFKEAATHFQKYGYYTADPWETPAWFEYWEEERKRVIHGYSVGGVHIPGDFYWYLNYSPILKVEDAQADDSRKVKGFPDFWDGDFTYYWTREIARRGMINSLPSSEEAIKDKYQEDTRNLKKKEKLALTLGGTQLAETERQIKELRDSIHKISKDAFDNLHLFVDISPENLLGGHNLVVGKSRRKGFSYKASAVGSRNYFTKPDTLTMYGAYEKRFLFPEGIFGKTKASINFINQNTGWATPADSSDKQDHIKASFIEYENGIRIEKGLMSELIAVSFKDNADAARGKDLEEGFFEEAGAFGQPGLLEASLSATNECVRAGTIQTGMLTIFGTSGDMEGGTADFANIHSRPGAFGCLPFNNVWDEGYKNTTCGFFHPADINLEGFYDSVGNSDRLGATAHIKAERQKMIDAGATGIEMQAKMQEIPLMPSEAFAAVSVNNFPVAELNRQLMKVKALQLYKKGVPVKLYIDAGIAYSSPILDGTATPITSLRGKIDNKRGCPVIYEHPVPNAPRGLYKIGYDPIRQNEGSSLAAIIVYKGVHKHSMFHSEIVAEYIGRYEDPEDIDRVAHMFALLYNTEVMYENEITSVKNYFRRHKILHLLAAQPDAVISKNIKKSKVARVYGCHMNVQMKDACERYTKSWLLTKLGTDENGDPITVIDRIFSVRLLEELIGYSRDTNSDLVSALFMALVQAEQEVLGKTYDEKKPNHKLKSLMEMRDKMRINRSLI